MTWLHRAGTISPTRPRGTRGTAGRSVATLGVGLVLALVAGSTAHAQTDDGLWYYRDTGVAEAHATTTGEGITVAVIDSPINPDVPELADADLTVHEPSFCDADGDGAMEPAVSDDPRAEHGTAMTSMIVGGTQGAGDQPGVRGVAPGARVLHYARGALDTTACADEGGQVIADAIDQAVADGAQILNLSFGSPIKSTSELDAIARAVRSGAVVVTPAGNDAGPITDWPALANGVVTVSGVDAQQQLETGHEVHGPGLDVVAPSADIRTLSGSDWQSYGLTRGTSSAAAWTSGVLALAWSAHPEATANQMIQTLLRNTISGGGELARADDYWGYGIVSVRRMLEADPSTYPDVNPLIDDSSQARPLAAELLSTTTTAEPEPTAGAAPDGPSGAAPTEPTDPVGTGPLVLGAAALLAAGAVAALLLARRRGQPTAHPPHEPQER